MNRDSNQLSKNEKYEQAERVLRHIYTDQWYSNFAYICNNISREEHIRLEKKIGETIEGENYLIVLSALTSMLALVSFDDVIETLNTKSKSNHSPEVA
jgi:hypothetical protein